MRIQESSLFIKKVSSFLFVTAASAVGSKTIFVIKFCEIFQSFKQKFVCLKTIDGMLLIVLNHL